MAIQEQHSVIGMLYAIVSRGICMITSFESYKKGFQCHTSHISSLWEFCLKEIVREEQRIPMSGMTDRSIPKRISEVTL